MKDMKALIIYPQYPETFWSFKYALKFAGKKAAFPPLGLLTMASMLPGRWEKKVIDMNIRRLKDRHLRWADCVMISAMDIQEESAVEVIRRCRKAGVKVIAGGPLFSSRPERFSNVDHLILGEAESTLPAFLDDLERSSPKRTYTKRVYSQQGFKEMDSSPPPLWELANINRYGSLSIQ